MKEIWSVQWEEEKCIEVSWGNMKEKDKFENTDVDGSIILKVS
jgi:hypothetical protein